MIPSRWDRSLRLVGPDGLGRLQAAHVAVFGLGGVGSFCVEGLARSAIGRLRLVDHDVVGEGNVNRQLHALSSTLGRAKVDVMVARIRDISPDTVVDGRREFFAADSAEALLDGDLDYVVDAIDALGPKVDLIRRCQQKRIPVVTVLGAAGRMDPTRLRVARLGDPGGGRLAARVRKLLLHRGTLEGVTAVISDEAARKPVDLGLPRMTDDLFRGRQRMIQPSLVMVPAAAGLAAAAVVVQAILRSGAGT
jgi:tRNA A37 threonylcarbamoyladenosine dehydratase